MLIHLNEDADLETWLPTVKWFPNMGGLDEFIRVVNKYPWADFTLPSEYAASHLPRGDVLVRQDLADGAGIGPLRERIRRSESPGETSTRWSSSMHSHR